MLMIIVSEVIFVFVMCMVMKVISLSLCKNGERSGNLSTSLHFYDFQE